jgi:hypothetical protein
MLKKTTVAKITGVPLPPVAKRTTTVVKPGQKKPTAPTFPKGPIPAVAKDAGLEKPSPQSPENRTTLERLRDWTRPTVTGVQAAAISHINQVLPGALPAGGSAADLAAAIAADEGLATSATEAGAGAAVSTLRSFHSRCAESDAELAQLSIDLDAMKARVKEYEARVKALKLLPQE